MKTLIASAIYLMALAMMALALSSFTAALADTIAATDSSSLLAQNGKTWEDFRRTRIGERGGSEAPADDPPTDSRRPERGFSFTASEPVASVALTQPIVYTRVPRTRGKHVVILKDGTAYTLESPDIWDRLPDSRHVFDGFNAPGQLVLRHPDGREQILYDCFEQKTPCVPLDLAVSLDGKKILFSVYRGKQLKSAWWQGTTLPNQHLASAKEAQLHVVELSSGKVTALAHQSGVFDVSPAWLPDGRIMFASTRDEVRQPKLDRISTNNRKVSQIYIANADGNKAVNISPHEVTTAMHPYVLQSGRVAYSSQWLSHNLAYGTNNSGINWPGTLDNMWLVLDMDLRGGSMNALLGAHRNAIKSATGRRKTMKALHFLGERRNGDICVANYYRGNNLGLGDVICWTPEPAGLEGAWPEFLPRIHYNVANWSKSNDEPSIRVNGIYQGKIGFPEGMEDNQLLLTVGRGFCTQVSGSVKSFQERVANQPEKRACQVGLYHTTRIPSHSMADLARVVDHDDWHEFGARVVAARKINTPPPLVTDDGSCQLASSDAGTAETSPLRAYQFNNNFMTSANNGGEIDGLPHSELAGIRFYEVVPNTASTRSFKNSIGNQLKLLGDAPLLADNSFIAQLPCDTPYVMAGIDKRGRVIKRDQVPQSLRPGEKRVCTGCHLHSMEGRPYEESLAYTAKPIQLMTPTPVPTYEQDIKPIFAKRCMNCHDSDVPLMDYKKLVWDHFQQAIPEERRIQVSDSKRGNRRWGLHRPYSSKYVNNMFARESLLYWKAANKRTDGRSDATFNNDIDFGADHPVDITEKELQILSDWLDSGATSIAK